MWLRISCFLGAQVGGALALDLSRNASQCVSNRGRPYSQEDCGEIAKAYGCIWVNSSCTCANRGTYSKRSHKCWPPEADPTTTTRMVFSVSNDSICCSNTGHPYDHENCDYVASQYGCEWKDGACVCSNGGYYAKSSHTCWPPSDPATTTTQQPGTSTTPAPTQSTCVSNHGHPYDRENCKWIAAEYGCSWVHGACSCSNGGIFSKTGKKCWPASEAPTPPPCKDCRDDTTGSAWTVALVSLVLGVCSCFLPCTRQGLRQGCQRCRRRRLAIQGSSQPVLLNVEEDHVEVVPTALQQESGEREIGHVPERMS